MNRTITRATLAGMLMLALCYAVPAQAEPIYVLGTGLGVSGLEFQAPHYFRSFAGQVLLDTGIEGTSDDFYAYCVDATRSRTLIQDMTIRPLSELPDNGNPANAQAGAGARIAWLINSYGTDAWLATDGNNRAAALQLAVWEVLYDPFGSYDITNGTFKLLYSDYYPELVSYTNSYFTNLGANTSEAIWYDVTDKNLTTGQDFAADPEPVPEPASILLFGSGLVGLVRYARGRRRQ